MNFVLRAGQFSKELIAYYPSEEKLLPSKEILWNQMRNACPEGLQRSAEGCVWPPERVMTEWWYSRPTPLLGRIFWWLWARSEVTLSHQQSLKEGISLKKRALGTGEPHPTSWSTRRQGIWIPWPYLWGVREALDLLRQELILRLGKLSIACSWLKQGEETELTEVSICDQQNS